MEEHGQEGAEAPARRVVVSNEEKDRLRKEFGGRLRDLLELAGLSSRVFAQRYPAYHDSTIRKYIAGGNLPAWDFLRDLLAEVDRRITDPVADQRAAELFTAYRTVLVAVGATTGGSDHNSLLLRLYDGEMLLRRLGQELAQLHQDQQRRHEELQGAREHLAASTDPGTANTHQAEVRRLETETEELSQRRAALVRRQADLLKVLDRDRDRLNPGGGDQQNQPVPPRPPHPPKPPELEPGKDEGKKSPGPRKALATALAFTLVLAGGVAGGIWYTRGHTPEPRPVTAGEDNATARTPPSPSLTPSADTATQDPSPTTLPPAEEESTPVTLPPLKTPSFTPPPGRTWSLIRDLAPMNDGSNGYTVGKIRVNTQDYPTTLYADNRATTWQLDREYTSLVTRLGVSDDASSGSTVEFTIQIDGRVARQITMKPGEDALSVDVELTGAFRLTLSVRSNIGLTVTNGAWIDPVLTK